MVEKKRKTEIKMTRDRNDWFLVEFGISPLPIVKEIASR